MSMNTELSVHHNRRSLTARMEPFDSFWEGPEDIEKGYSSFSQFYRVNYLPKVPEDRNCNVLVISCGPGYFVNMLKEQGYANVIGIDSMAQKVEHAVRRGLNCQAANAHEFLADHVEAFDAIICEQELNHLTKDEMIDFLNLARASLKPGGTLISHGLNGANPITGAEALAQNFDHYNTFTEYTLNQVLEYCGYENIDVFPLHLYVFYKNPANYVAWAASGLLSLAFRFLFIMYGKSNKIFSKKIAASCVKPAH